MKKINILIVICLMTFALSGCKNSTDKIAKGNGGIYKSTDAGKNFKDINVINENNNLSNTSVKSIAINPMNSNVVYIGTVKDGIYKSTDAGKSWIKNKSGFKNVKKIELDPSNENVIYIIATLDGESALFKTLDAGINWNKLLAQRNSKNPTFLDIIIDKKNSNILYASDSTGGVFKSLNSGKEWNTILWSNSPVKSIKIDSQNNQQIYLLTESGEIHSSNNGGASFQEIDRKNRIYEVYSIDVSKFEEKVLYVLTSAGLYLSKDGGLTYAPIETLLPPKNATANLIITDTKNKNVLYLIAGKILYKTTNAGKTWEAISLNINWEVKSFLVIDNSIYMGLSKPLKKRNDLFPF